MKRSRSASREFNFGLGVGILEYWNLANPSLSFLCAPPRHTRLQDDCTPAAPWISKILSQRGCAIATQRITLQLPSSTNTSTSTSATSPRPSNLLPTIQPPSAKLRMVQVSNPAIPIHHRCLLQLLPTGLLTHPVPPRSRRLQCSASLKRTICSLPCSTRACLNQYVAYHTLTAASSANPRLLPLNRTSTSSP